MYVSVWMFGSWFIFSIYLQHEARLLEFTGSEMNREFSLCVSHWHITSCSYNNLLHNSTMYCCGTAPTGLCLTLGCKEKLVRAALSWKIAPMSDFKRLPVTHTHKSSRYDQWATHIFESGEDAKSGKDWQEKENRGGEEKRGCINKNLIDRKESINI